MMGTSGKSSSGIDWSTLAEELGALRKDGESCERSQARAALERIVGEDALRDAVDQYVAERPGAELIRLVLGLFRPWPAMQRCMEVFDDDGNPDARVQAVELLRHIADARVLDHVPRFLDDDDPKVQTMGAGILDRLLWANEVEEADCRYLLERLARHDNPEVRACNEFIVRYLYGGNLEA